MKVGILIYPNCSLWSAIGPMELLLRANKTQQYFYGEKASHIKFDIEFVASHREAISTSYSYPIACQSNIFSNKIYDLVFIPGFDYDPEKILQDIDECAQWIKLQHDNKAKIASICTGSFLLAQSGIVKDKPITTHWVVADRFKKLFPDSNFCSDKIIIDNDDTLICGGATSFNNLIIYIIEKYMGRRVAIGVSKLYLIDVNKDNQDSYSVFRAHKNHNDHEILTAQNMIELNCNKKIFLDDIANKLAMSKRNLIRRFKKATGETPFHYIQKVKVEKAKSILENENKTFEEIVFEVGYEDINAFRKIFMKYTGLAPTKYKKRYSLYN